MATDGAGRLLDTVDAQESALRAAEEAASANASAPLRAAIAAIVARALVAADRGEPFEQIMQRVRDELLALPESLIDSSALLASFEDAFDLGVQNGREQQRQADRDKDEQDLEDELKRQRRLPKSVQDVADQAGERAIEALRNAVQNMVAPASAAQLAAQLARANAAVTSVQRTASVGVNLGASLGVERVATTSALDKLWLPERDACLHCLRYAGLHVPAGQSFPGGLTFDRKPLSTEPIPNPPLHPFCRCRLALYNPRNERPGEVTLPDALKREAKRSVLLGFSLPSESETRRLEGAERLLREGAGMPKGVEAYAQRALDRGEFYRGRDVPAGDGSKRSIHKGVQVPTTSSPARRARR